MDGVTDPPLFEQQHAHTSARRVSVVFSWYGLPQYAARLVKEAIAQLNEECLVLGTRPDVPIQGMESILGDSLQWVDAAKPLRWSDIGCTVPDIFVQSGWRYPAFAALGREVKRNGGFVIGLSDANWRGDLRQMLAGPLLFRLLYRRHFDAMIVPGSEGARLMRYFGMPAHAVRHGMYGADSSLFHGGPSLRERDRLFLFVGQFIARKDVLTLARAFLRFAERRPGWKLRLCGSGVQRSLLPQHPSIAIEEFVQPHQLVDHYRQARFFVLPSLVEAWGLVVHEAALCGCPLILSDKIGSSDDLATPLNSVRFSAGNEESLLRALHAAAEFDDERLDRAESVSRANARAFGPGRFAREISQLVQTARTVHRS